MDPGENPNFVQKNDLTSSKHGNNRIQKELRCDHEGTLICGRKPWEHKAKDFGRCQSISVVEMHLSSWWSMEIWPRFSEVISMCVDW